MGLIKGLKAISAMVAIFVLSTLSAFAIRSCAEGFVGETAEEAEDGDAAPDAGPGTGVKPDDANAVAWAIDLSLPRSAPRFIGTPAGLSVVRQTVVVTSTKTDPATKKQMVGWCTGFMLRPGLAVTMAHCVDDAKRDPLSVYCDEKTVEAKVIAVDPIRDLMLLEADCKAVPLALGLKRPPVNEPLRITGFAFDVDATGPGPMLISAERYILPTSAIPGARLEPDELQETDATMRERVLAMNRRRIPRDVALSGMMRSGNSGSPVFRENGEVVGVLTSISIGHGRSYMVPAYSIARMMEKAGLKLE